MMVRRSGCGAVNSGAHWDAAQLRALYGLDVAFVIYFTVEVLAKLCGLSIETCWQDA